jgi:hypothetical protein
VTGSDLHFEMIIVAAVLTGRRLEVRKPIGTIVQKVHWGANPRTTQQVQCGLAVYCKFMKDSLQCLTSVRDYVSIFY